MFLFNVFPFVAHQGRAVGVERGRSSGGRDTDNCLFSAADTATPLSGVIMGRIEGGIYVDDEMDEGGIQTADVCAPG